MIRCVCRVRLAFFWSFTSSHRCFAQSLHESFLLQPTLSGKHSQWPHVVYEQGDSHVLFIGRDTYCEVMYWSSSQPESCKSPTNSQIIGDLLYTSAYAFVCSVRRISVYIGNLTRFVLHELPLHCPTYDQGHRSGGVLQTAVLHQPDQFSSIEPTDDSSSIKDLIVVS